MYRSAFVLSLALLTIGCHHSSSVHQARYYDDGRLKPAVALIPVINSADQECGWDLSNELTHSIVHRLALRDKLFLVDHGKTAQVFHQLGHSHNPFGKDIDWVKQSCPEQDFAVFLELIEHAEVPIRAYQEENPANCSAEFNISLRVRVIDLRTDVPKIVLQEIIHDHHHIPKQFTKYHFHQEPWGNDSFAISPIGLAHAQLVKETVSRVEEYILTARGG
ncbi:MAG: hypothetical protein KGZ39_02475 [Simkania sp.]|nr:hypothetical protein [Simkania sp.]